MKRFIRKNFGRAKIPGGPPRRALLLTVLFFYILAASSTAAVFSILEAQAKYTASASAEASGRVARWDVRAKDELAAGYRARIYPSAETPGVQPFIFFPEGKAYWHISLRVENASEVAAGCKFSAEVKHTPATAQISGGCTKASGHTGSCTNVPAVEVQALTAGYSYGADGIVLPPATGPAAPTSCEVQIKIPRTTCTDLQIYADFVQID